MGSTVSYAVTALLHGGLRKVPEDCGTLGWVALGLVEELGRWAECPEVPGWARALG